MWAHLRARAMGAAGSTPDSLEGSDVATERVSAPSTTSAPRETSTSGGHRWGWDEVLGTLAESEAISSCDEDVDATQSTWQRALQAKTAAVRRLELELERRDLRIRALEVDRATREEGDAFASGEDDASRLATEADASRALALRPASAVIDDMRRDMEDREYRLTALTEAIHRSSERSVENEVAVSAARDELVARAERYRASETRLARQLEASRAVEENLREEIREGERAFGLLQSQFAAVVARARVPRARRGGVRVAPGEPNRDVEDDGATPRRSVARDANRHGRLESARTPARSVRRNRREESDGDEGPDAFEGRRGFRGRRGARLGDGDRTRAVTAALEAAAAEREALTRERDETRARLETETASLRAEVEALRRANAVRVEDGVLFARGTRRTPGRTRESEEGPSTPDRESEPTTPTRRWSNDGSAACSAAGVVGKGDVATGKDAPREEDPEFREMRRRFDGLRAALAWREET